MYILKKMPLTRLRNKIRICITGILLLSGLFAAPLSSQDTREAYFSALAKMQENRYPEAIALFSRAMESDPDNSLYVLKRAECHYELKQYREALDNLRILQELGSGEADFLAARCYAGLNDLENCITAMRAHLSSDNRLPESTILLDEAFTGFEDDRQWIGLWKEEWYREEDYLIAEINYLISSGDHLDAIESLNGIINSGQADHRYYALRARAFEGLGNLNNAQSDFTRAIEGNSSIVGYYLERADLYVRLGKPDRALPDFSKAIRIQPDRFETYYSRAQAYLAVSDYEAASSDMEFLLRFFPDNTAYLYETGMIQYSAKKYIKALEQFNKLLRISADSSLYFMARGNTYLKTGYYKYALQDYSMALDLDPYNAECYLNKGLSRFHLGDKKGACIDWEKAEKNGSSEAGDLLSKHCGIK